MCIYAYMYIYTHTRVHVHVQAAERPLRSLAEAVEHVLNIYVEHLLRRLGEAASRQLQKINFSRGRDFSRNTTTD